MASGFQLNGLQGTQEVQLRHRESIGEIDTRIHTQNTCAQILAHTQQYTHTLHTHNLYEYMHTFAHTRHMIHACMCTHNTHMAPLDCEQLP